MHIPPELVEQIIYHGWNCLSSSSHRHGYSMTQWMLVSRDWLKIVLPVVFRDLWLTSRAHAEYINSICEDHPSFICTLAGITDVHKHLKETCQSLTISVYHQFDHHYSKQCKDLIEYPTDEHRLHLLRSVVTTQERAISNNVLAEFIRMFTPHIAALHFVLIDCNTTYREWEAWESLSGWRERKYPLSLVELQVAFVYTSPPPAFLLDAPRGTFFPPRISFDIPCWYTFHGVKKLVVRDANADFVAFLTTACPRLEKIESTAEFRIEDVPEEVPVDVKERLVFTRLPRTTVWPGVTGADTVPRPADWLDKMMDEIRRRRGFKVPPRPQVALSPETQVAPPQVVVDNEVTSANTSRETGVIVEDTSANLSGTAGLPPETQVVPPRPQTSAGLPRETVGKHINYVERRLATANSIDEVVVEVTSAHLLGETEVVVKTRKNIVWRLAKRIFQGRKWRI
ncbi:hypothetical protein DFH06DRAFT_1224718 [Mycena polygramma]|nr:hypothetical protein DFH06DRAFT_1224718 [Mycena polygramma]